MTERRNWTLIIRQALFAGIVAGITLEAYVLLTTVLPAHGSAAQLWQWIASSLLGQIAFSNPSYAVLGLIVHFCVSIAWAGGYAYLAATQPFMNERWYISGPVYGLVVYILMDILLLGVRMFVPPDFTMLLNAVVAHAVFFGVPVAYTVSRLSSAR